MLTKTSPLYLEYLRNRAKGYLPRSARAYAAQPARPGIDWDGYTGYATAEVEYKGYVVRLKQEYDECPDLSYLGEYSHRSGVIDREARGDMNRNESRYWSPMTTEAEHFKALHRMGMDKNTAHEKARGYVLQDYRRMESYNRDGWSMIGIIAKAYLVDGEENEIECGEAALWGIESDFPEHIDDCAWDLVKEAVFKAEANRMKMIEKRAKEILTLSRGRILS